MKTNRVSPRRRSGRIDAARRAQLLATFDRSGLSAAAFARQHGLNYTTFCGGRAQRAKTRTGPELVQVEVAAPAPPVELVIEMGPPTRLRVQSEGQIVLAARLLRSLNTPAAC
jgi:transposase-like protein